MTRPVVRNPGGPVPFLRPEPTGDVGPPRPPEPAHDGVRPPTADRKPSPPTLSRAELRRIVIDILG
jgi:hypothetical protein